MTNRPATFKQVDVTRAVKGAVAAGLSVGRIEIDQRTGKIVIFSAGPGADDAANSCDRLLR
jgi:hypothetical protein